MAISWGTLSSHGANRDQEIPNIAPDATRKVHRTPKSSYTWLKSSPLNSKHIFPRYGAGVAQSCSKDGHIYLQGGLVDGSTVKSDFWAIETQASGQPCSRLQTRSSPGPRVGHAALLRRNAFIVFGGDTRMHNNETLDSALYLMNTRKHHIYASLSNSNFVRYQRLVSDYVRLCTTRSIRSLGEYRWQHDCYVWWTGRSQVLQ